MLTFPELFQENPEIRTCIDVVEGFDGLSELIGFDLVD